MTELQAAEVPSPLEIFEEIRRTVLGQDEALREVSVALTKHLLGHPGGNVLLVGNSGSGKTTLMRAVEQFLARRPELAHHSNVIRINANVLAEERGGYGKAVLSRLFANALRKLGPQTPIEQLLKWVERGIVFIDEVDKIRSRVGDASNAKGIVAQEALLTLMENENVEFDIDQPMPATVSINSSGILFVVAGAFEELYEDVFRRALVGSEVVQLKPMVVVSASGDVREELPFHLRNYIRYEDLFRYGMAPQFVSRFESVVVMNDLADRDLARIFVEPEGSIFRVSRDFFRRFNIDLQITKGAIQLIAWEAARQKRLGARALKEIYRRVIRGIEFDPSAARITTSANGQAVVTVDEEMVRQAIAQREQGTSKPK